MSFLFIAIMNNHENVIGIDEHVLFAGSCAWRHAMAMVIIPWRQERLVRSTLGKPQQQEMGETGVEQKRRSFQPGNRLRKHTWLVVWSIFFYIYIYILGIIIPTDFHIFQRGGSTTIHESLRILELKLSESLEQTQKKSQLLIQASLSEFSNGN